MSCGRIVSRLEAKSSGLKRYFTGVPCAFGHICERYTDNYGCCECRKDAYQRFIGTQRHNDKKSYYRARYLKNREHRMAYMREYYAKNADRWKGRTNERNRKVADLLAVLELEMPELLKEFGL